MTEENPFAKLSLSSQVCLFELDKRSKCTSCGKSTKYYCQNCAEPCHQIMGKVPKVPLPIKITILKHQSELNSKITAVHSKLIAPDDVDLVTIKGQSEIEKLEALDHEYNVVLFPHERAVSVGSLDSKNVQNFIFIDGTWSQAKSISTRFKKVKFAVITHVPVHGTLFWRYQSLGKSALSTIEAIYYFLKEITGDKSGKFDDLLWFYSFNYTLIQDYYKKHTEKKFTDKHQLEYIKY